MRLTVLGAPIEPQLDVQDVSLRYAPGGATAPEVLKSVTFRVHPGEIFALVGPSGSGKSSILRALMGFERHTTGRIRHGTQIVHDGKSRVAPERRGIGIVFQGEALFPHLSALKNTCFGIRAQGRAKLTRDERRKRGLFALRQVGLEDFADRLPGQLSGGQRQRVALARVLAADLRTMLLDEPFSNLDANLRASSRDLVRRLTDERQLATVVVTHDQAEALSVADTVGVLRDGRIDQIGTPREVYETPATDFVARLTGPVNLLTARASGRAVETPLGRLPLREPAEGQRTIAIRPEQLSLTRLTPAPGTRTVTDHAAARLPMPSDGRISRIEYFGHDRMIHVELATLTICALVPPVEPFETGDRVRVAATQPLHALPTERSG